MTFSVQLHVLSSSGFATMLSFLWCKDDIFCCKEEVFCVSVLYIWLTYSCTQHMIHQKHFKNYVVEVYTQNANTSLNRVKTLNLRDSVYVLESDKNRLKQPKSWKTKLWTWRSLCWTLFWHVALGEWSEVQDKVTWTISSCIYLTGAVQK